eukprot:7029175-Prymnesium_polylepis.1
MGHVAHMRHASTVMVVGTTAVVMAMLMVMRDADCGGYRTTALHAHAGFFCPAFTTVYGLRSTADST